MAIENTIPPESIREFVLLSMAMDSDKSGCHYTAKSLRDQASGINIATSCLPHDLEKNMIFATEIVRWCEELIRDETFGKDRDALCERLEAVAERLEKTA